MVLSLAVLPGYLAAVSLITVSPGPDTAYIVAVAAHRGPRAGVLSAVGMALGMVVHVTAASLGLALLLRSTPVALTGLRLAGAAYLAWLAVTTLRSARRSGHVGSAPAAHRRIMGRAILTNLTNPKIILFFAALLPQFVRPESGPLAAQFLMLGLIFLVIGLAWDSTVGVAAGQLANLLKRGGRAATTLNVSAGLTFAALALTLVWQSLP
jgi:threonine/homoserine/homoserine lactone efflux protein